MTTSVKESLERLLNYLAKSAWFSYLTIILLQLKVMLWIWQYRDLAPGDTSYYYKRVFTWNDDSNIDLVWSPIYTLFLATLHNWMDNPFWVLITIQMAVSICASILILTLFRKIFPHALAWGLAAWWVILPINFDTVYSVHLFSSLAPLLLFVIAVYYPNIYGRGLVLGGLLFTAALVRNEYSPLFILWLCAFLGYEIYLYNHKEQRKSFASYLLAYGAPLLSALLIIGALYGHATHKYPEIKKVIEPKHTLNVCQIYAYNRLQQGDSWSGNPWTECQELIERDFGVSTVSFSQALFLNPRAIFEHMWWNIKLIPSGTQLALFDNYASGHNPDYIPARQSAMVWVPFSLMLVLSGFALVKYFIVRPLTQRQLPENLFVWLLMLSAAALVVGIMIMQRPRPSYMFTYSLFIMALTGLGLRDLGSYMRIMPHVKSIWPGAVILLVMLIPAHYDATYINHFGYKGQRLRDSYERIAPYLNRHSSKSPVVIATPSGDGSLCGYLDISSCTIIPYGQIAGPNFESQVSTLGVNWVYMDNTLGSQTLIYNREQWQVTAFDANLWILLHRQTPN